MSELCTRMIRDMAVRGFSPRTHEAYIAAVARLAKYYKRSPDQLINDEVQAYLAHLIQERKLSWSTCSQAAHAFRFLYHVTPGHSRTDFHVPAPKQPQKLPEILSREEVWRLLNACPHTGHRLLLATTDAAGLRVSEVVALKVSALDADRMTVRVEQGKGRKDRYVPLAKRLLHDFRAYWQTAPPGLWLFANRQRTRPIDITVAQKIYTMAKLRAGIRKPEL
jgi:integrase/recombinase XerD